jgi:hypothetical protein
MLPGMLCAPAEPLNDAIASNTAAAIPNDTMTLAFVPMIESFL